jgi:hypothetical protein
LSSTPQFNHEQLTAARKQRWHQGDDALLTLEDARAWVGELGLVLFAPREQQLPAPAPSLVEATLGRAASAPSAAETETARGLLARLTAEGTAIPLNLLGGPGDVPDFVVSAQVFSYVFTLRGDKAWKQPPATSGSPLALKVYEALAQGGALSAAELVSELGRELTQNAILRSLTELWSQLRVIPLLQQDGSATLWELTSRRFTKQIKAGANAGQPTALSALISLYLAQSYAAVTDEVEVFLSPLAARSRVRDVLHGLTAGRQLEDVVLEGKTLLYIPGALPEFPEATAAEPAAEAAATEIAAPREAASGERIRRFDRPRTSREDRPRTPRPGGPRAPREDRPRASRPGGPRSSRDERPRPARDERPRAPRPDRPREDRNARPFRGERERPAKPYGAAKRFGDSAKPFRKDAKPSGDRAKPFGEKPRGPRPEGKSFGDRERRPFQRDQARPERPSFSRPWDEDRKPRAPREGSERREQGERPFREKSERPAKSFGGSKSFGGAKPFRGAKPAGAGPRGPRPERKSFGDRERRPFQRDRGTGASDRGERGERPYRPRREGGEGFAERPAKPYRRREEGETAGGQRRAPSPRSADKKGFGGKPKFGSKPGGKPAFGARPGSKSGGKPGGKPSFGTRPSGKPGGKPSYGARPGGKPGAKPSFGGKPFGRKPGGKPKFSGKPGPRKPSSNPRRETEE